MAKSKSKKADIKSTPSVAVTNLAKPKKKRSGSKATFTTSWKYPKAAFNDQKSDRFEGVLVKWVVDLNTKSKVSAKKKTATIKTTVETKKNGKTTKKTKKETVKGIGYLKGVTSKKSKEYVYTLKGSGKTKHTFKVSRKSYYPFGGVSKKFVKVYIVKKATWSKDHWVITGSYVEKIALSSAKAYVTASTKLLQRKKLTAANKKALGITKANEQTIVIDPIVKKSTITKKNSTVFGKKNNPEYQKYIVGYTGKNVTSVKAKNAYLSGVGVLVQGWNSRSPKNKKKKVTWAKNVKSQAAYFDIKPPDPPTITYSVAGEASNHTITFSIKSEDDGTIAKERYDTYYTLTKEYRFGTALKAKSKTAVITKNTNSKLEFKVSRNPNLDVSGNDYVSILGLKNDEYVKYTLTAYNRGFAGDSKTVSKSFTFARPHWVSIRKVETKGSHFQILFDVQNYVDGAKDSKKLRDAHPSVRYTTKYTLQRLANFRPSGSGYGTNVDDWSDAQWLAAARSQPANSWTDVYTVGAGERVFLDQRFLAAFEPFKRTYYRILPANDIYGMEGTASTPVVVPGYLKIPSAVSEATKFLSVTSTEDGEAIQAVVAFHKSKLTGTGSNGEKFEYVNSNGTEMSWDTAAYAWESTKPASTYDFMDDSVSPKLTYTKDDSGKPTGVEPAVRKWLQASDIYTTEQGQNKLLSDGFNAFRTYYIRDVQPMTKYYLRARRFLKSSGTRETDSYGSYAQYSNGEAAATIEVKSRPKNLKAAGPTRLIEGKDLSITWTYESDDTQTEYQVYFFQGNSNAALQKPTPVDILTTRVASDKETSIKDSAPYAVIPWSKISPGSAKDEWIFDHVVYVGVKVKCDSDWSDMSNIVAVTVVRAPQARIGDVAAVTTKTPSFTLYSTDNKASAIVRIIAPQISDWGPAGQETYPDGTVVYSNKYVRPSWSTKATVLDKVSWYSMNITLPNGIDLRSGYTYTLEYVAVNDETGLRSDSVNEDGELIAASKSFSVTFLDNVPQPSFYVYVDDPTEEHSSSAHIVVKEEAGTIPTGTTLEVYRVTIDGAHKIFESDNWRNASKTITIQDPYPPYSQYTDCQYRVAYRSANGVVEWADRTYNLHGYAIRFDWGDPDAERHGSYTHVTLPYNVRWSDSWAKNARVELHMDGQYAGYWRKGVDRKNTMSTELVKMTGAEQVARVMALANYAGPVLVRLPNRTVFCANVTVDNLDVSYDSLTVSASFSAQQISMAPEFVLTDADGVAGAYKPITS